MPIPSRLMPAISTLKTLDPSRHSLNADGEKTHQRSCLENFFGYLIYILSFGMRAKNPALDQATDKMIGIAEAFFADKTNPKCTLEEQTELVSVFTKLQTIVEKNQGSDGAKLQALIAKIQKLTLAPNSDPIAAPNAHENQLIVLLNSCLENRNNAFGKRDAERRVIAFLENNNEPLPFIEQDDALGKSIIEATLNSDLNFLVKIKPVTLQVLVHVCISKREVFGFSIDLLSRICNALETLTYPHPLIDAFADAFPNWEHLSSITEKRNYYKRMQALNLYNIKDENAPEHHKANQCYEFLLSKSFEKLLPKLTETQRASWLNNLCGYSVFFLYDNGGMGWKIKDQQLIEFIQGLSEPNRRPVIESLLSTREPKILAHLCLQDAADRDIVEKVLKLNPSNQQEWNQGELEPKIDSDPFLERFINEVNASESPNKDQVLEWIIDCVFQGTDSTRQKHLISYLKPSFYAHRFHLLPEAIARNQHIWKIVEALDARPEKAEAMQALARSRVGVALTIPEITANEKSVLTLLKTGEPNFQAHLLSTVLSACIGGDDIALKLLTKILTTFPLLSPEVWKNAGLALRVASDVNFNEKYYQAWRTLPTNALTNLLQGVTNCATISPQLRTELIGSLHGMLIVRPDVSISDLSEEMLTTVNAYRLMPFSARDVDTNKAENYFWYHILKALKNPEDALQKRILIRLSQKLANDLKSNPPKLQQFISCLNQTQISHLPWQTFSKPFQLLFITMQNISQAHSEAVCTLASSLSDQEQYEFLSLYQYLRFPYLHEFLEALMIKSELTAPFCSAFFKVYYRTGQLLTLPRKLLMANLNAVNDPTLRTELLRSLPLNEAKTALETWWKDFDWKRGDHLLDDHFPFDRMLEVVEDPEQIRTMAAIPTGTFAVQSIPPRSLYSGVIRDVLASFEKDPWKLWVALNDVNVAALYDWYQGEDNPRALYPKCYAIIDWYYDKPNEKYRKDEIEAKFAHATDLINQGKWDEVSNEIDSLDENQKNYLLAAVKGPSPEALARSVHNLTDLQLFAALFDEAARTNLVNALLTGVAKDHGFEKFVKMLQELEKCPAYFEEMTEEFSSKLSIQDTEKVFDLDYWDIEVQIWQKKLTAPKALLSLDPYFKPSLSNNEGPVVLVIPSNESSMVEWRMKRLCNLITISEAASPEGQSFLRSIKDEKTPSLSDLFDAPQFSDVTIVAGATSIKAHKCILTKLPYFKKQFSQDPACKEIKLPSIVDPASVKLLLLQLYKKESAEMPQDNRRTKYIETMTFFSNQNT